MAWISRQDAAKRMGVSVRTLDGLISRGDLPASRLGNKLVRIDEKNIDKYMNARTIAPEPKQRARHEPVMRPCKYVPGMKVV